MRIKNQFIISMAVFSIVVTIIAGSVVITEQQLAETTSQQSTVGVIERGANDLNYISNSYFLYQENEQISEWQSEYATLSEKLSSLSLNSPQQQTILSNIEGDLQRLNSVFAEVVIFLENAPRNVSVRIDPIFQSQWNRMAVQSKALASDASQLSQVLENEENQIKLENLVLIFSLLMIFSAFFITVYLIAFRRTLKSISKLQAGIKVIGSGNLNCSLETSKQDEIDELSDAFNQMTANLKTVTTSKTELENEITERKKVEDELRRAEEITRNRTEELEKTHKKLEEYANQMEAIAEERARQLKDSERLAAIGATAGMVGHDIRNPLQTVTGELYLAKSELQNIPDGIAKKNLKESLDVIGEQTIYVNKIVSDLQDYAKPLTPKLEETDLKNIIQSVLSSVDIPENVKVKQSIEKDFPKLKIDQSYMQRILQNLINNAVQAMPNGGKLNINVAIVAEKAVIAVEDTGEGIPLDVRGKLFTPLITTKAKGQGFGLAVVKRLTDALNGTVTFNSEAGKGTKFIIELPLPETL